MATFVSNALSLPKQFRSGQILGGTNLTPNINLVAAGFANSDFTANIRGSNTFYPFFSPGLQTPNDANSTLAFDGFTSNSMITSDSFNIIKVDLHNKSDSPIKLSAFYSNTDDLNNASIKYSTIIAPQEVFYRNYPVENKFFQMALTQITTDVNTFAEIDGKVAFTKFTQYNTPSQLSDKINRFTMSDINRNGNDYLDDVLINRLEDINKTSRIGICDSILTQRQNVWNFNGKQDFSSLTNTACLVRSDSVNDNNLNIVISGWSEDSEPPSIISEEVTLGGTSNAGLITEFKMITDMRVQNANNTTKFNNEGTIEVYRFGTNELMAQMKAEQGRMTSFQYVCPPSYNAVIKEVHINGNTGFNLESKLNMYRVTGSNGSRELIYQNNEFDSHINSQIDLNIGLTSFDIVYASIDSSNTGSTDFGDSQYFLRMNILEYPTATNSLT
jgi:hypothetical protein